MQKIVVRYTELSEKSERAPGEGSSSVARGTGKAARTMRAALSAEGTDGAELDAPSDG